MNNTIRRRRAGILTVIFILFVCAVAFSPIRRLAFPARPVVSSVHPTTGPIRDVLVNKGTVSYERQITLRSHISGYVTKLPYIEGDGVRTGVLVAEVQDQRLHDDLSSREVEVKNVSEKLDAIKNELNGLRAIYEAGGIPKLDIERKELEQQAAANDLKKSRLELNRLKSTVSLSNITSPFDGIIMSVKANVGQWLNAGEEVLVLTGGGNKSLVANVDALDLKHLSKGQKVYFSDQEEAVNMRVGEIVDISKIIGAGQNQNLAKITIRPLDAIDDLRISQQLYLEFVVFEADNVVRLSREYVHKDSTSYYVFTLKNGVVHKTPIKVINGDSKYWAIQEGITAQDIVLRNEKSELIEGEKYEVRDDTTRFN
ncbi:MAG: efflux RND transporter periplasmic adaptor subunit [Gallionella sp.]